MKTWRIAVAAGIAILVGLGFIFVRNSPPSDLSRKSASEPLLGHATDKAGVPPRALPAVQVWPKSSTERARLTPNPADAEMLDSILLVDQFGALVARAHKDPAFAQTLAFALYQCSIELKYRDELEKSLDRMTAEEATAAMAKEDKDFGKCKGLNSEQRALRFELAEMAARAGVLAAQVYYSTYVASAITDGSAISTPNALDQYRQNTEAFLQAAARSGDPQGLYSAYELYYNGRLVPRNLVLAYKYAEEYARVHPTPVALDSLARLSRRMTPDQLRQAQSR